jgi:hypothetical protein
MKVGSVGTAMQPLPPASAAPKSAKNPSIMSDPTPSASAITADKGSDNKGSKGGNEGSGVGKQVNALA